MAKTQFNVEQFKTEAVKPLYAVAGATELAVELARGYAAEAQKATQGRITEVQSRVSGVQARVAKVDLEPKALRISAEQVYVQAGILNPDDDQVRSVELAILGDPMLSERQKQALLEVYKAFRTVSVLTDPQDALDSSQPHAASVGEQMHAPTDVEAGTPGQATPTEGI